MKINMDAANLVSARGNACTHEVQQPSCTVKMTNTKVQTLGAIPGRQSEHALMKRVFEKVHTLIKCTCNGGIQNIAGQKTECNGTCTLGRLFVRM